ncbi:MAG: TlpA disulfide reductase family protein [Bacteroidota bacterium]|nr:TlpA disulfide reductase family protein [Bacteroidota bacterium]
MIKKFGIFISVTFLIFGCKQNEKTILDKVVANLNSMKTVEYKRILNDSGTMGSRGPDTTISYFDFTSTDTLLGSKYYFVSKVHNIKYEGKSESVFDGKKWFDAFDTLILFDNNPKKYRITSNLNLHASLYSYRKLLPEILKDTSIKISLLKDTLVNNIPCFNFKITMKDQYMFSDSLIKELGAKVIYKFLASKTDYLPVQFIQEMNGGFFVFTYYDIKKGVTISDSIWSYDRFPSFYRRYFINDWFNRGSKEKMISILNKQAPNFTLPQIGGDSVTLSILKGSVVLLDFWFPNCGPCMKAIPYINDIKSRYEDKGLKVYGIEFTNSDVKELEKFIPKWKIEYPILYNGNQVSKLFGVNAGPTIILIDKTGRVVCFNHNDKAEIIKNIEKYL